MKIGGLSTKITFFSKHLDKDDDKMLDEYKKHIRKFVRLKNGRLEGLDGLLNALSFNNQIRLGGVGMQVYPGNIRIGLYKRDSNNEFVRDDEDEPVFDRDNSISISLENSEDEIAEKDCH